ncbi:HNH endonuclease [Gordonia sp. DT30]|uniref:HNH endonuclease signature motif containing protein n=1 Tax=Gordonia sp. DT30 TaxID=3416546 RepID=UPI003CF643C1
MITRELFCYTDSEADLSAIDGLSSTDVTAATREIQTLQYQNAARTVFLADRLAAAVLDELSFADRLGHPHIDQLADKAIVGEVSVRLGISRTQARSWLFLASALRVFPALLDAFMAGRFAIRRTQIIVEELSVLPDRTDDEQQIRDHAERLAIAMADGPVHDSVLRERLAEMVIALAPEFAAAGRRDHARDRQHVTVRKDANGHAQLNANVPAEVGVHLRQRISALIEERLCADDRRPAGVRQVDALREIQGMPGYRLACKCGREGCAGRIPEPMPEWMNDLHDDDLPDEPRAESEPAESESAGPEPVPSETAVGEQTALTVITDPTGRHAPRLQGFGAIDPAHAVDLIGSGAATAIGGPTFAYPSGSSDSLDEYLWALGEDLATWQRAALVADHGLAPPVDSTGHGGESLPPPGALRYRPSRRMIEKIVALDRICRYPGCGKPAADCEIDHVVKFRNADPENGGWTVEFNLAALCTPDHHRKHMGLWIPTMRADRTITWRSPHTGETVVTYPG